jgi:hypothetical protein
MNCFDAIGRARIALIARRDRQPYRDGEGLAGRKARTGAAPKIAGRWSA